jgi:hypothetical protein
MTLVIWSGRLRNVVWSVNGAAAAFVPQRGGGKT